MTAYIFKVYKIKKVLSKDFMLLPTVENVQPQMGQVMQKRVLHVCHMRTTKAQISLRISAD